MVDFNDERSWTTVVRRRAVRRRPSSQVDLPLQSPTFREQTAAVPGSSISLGRGASAAATAQAQGNGEEDHDDETLVLLRMKRSIERLQSSQFLKRFLDQTASPPVLNNLRRAAVSPPPLKMCTQEFTDDIRATRTADIQGIGEEETVERFADFASQAFEFVEETASGTSSAKTLAHKRNGIAYSLKDASATSDRDGEVEEVASGKDKASAGITIEEWQFHIVVYGLGKIAYSEVSRCQLACVLSLKQNFQWVGGIEIYDPVLSQSESRVIRGLGCSITSINEEGRRSIEKPTLFYMPHCEDWLYDNVLKANWNPLQLRQLVLLGNSFRSYQEAWSSFLGQRSKLPPTYLLELQPSTHEIPVEATSSLDIPAFNNLSWHFFPSF